MPPNKRIYWTEVDTFKDYMNYRHTELKGYPTPEDSQKYRHIKEGWTQGSYFRTRNILRILQNFNPNNTNKTLTEATERIRDLYDIKETIV